MRKKISLTEAEEKLAALIWRDAPLTSPELVHIAGKEMSWKRTTTYTVLKKLCDKGVFKNANANISVVLTRDELIAYQSRLYVEDTFGGSLPKFIASFIGEKKLSPEQAEELRCLIDEHERSGNNG